LLHDTTATFTYNPSTNTVTATTFSGALSGNATTATTATTATNATNVTVTTDTASSAYKIPFANTTASTTANYGLLQDSTATFTYNPSLNQLAVGNITTTGNVDVNSGDVIVDQDREFQSTRFTLGNTNSDVYLQNLGTGAGSDTFFLMNNSASYEGLVIRNLGGVELYHADSLQFVTTSHTASDAGTGATIVDGTGTMQPVGFNAMPVYEIDTADTFDLAHAGMLWHKDTASAVAFTCALDTTIPVGAMWMVQNEGAGDVTIVESSTTIRFLFPGGTPTTGTVTVAEGGIVSVYKYADAEYWVWGANQAASGGTPAAITVADESADTTCFPAFFTAATGDLGPKTGSNLTFNSSTGDLGATLFTGSGAGLTSLVAANISSGNLGSAVLPYYQTNATSTNYKVPFINTTGTASGNFLGFHDSGSTFTYNPSTNTLVAGVFSGSGASLTALNATNISTGTLAVAQGGTGATATTGTGNNVLSASPTLSGTAVIPIINNSTGVALQYNGTDAIRTKDGNALDDITAAEVYWRDTTYYDVGLAVMPEVTATGAVTLSELHIHKTILITSGTGAISFVSDTGMAVGSVGWIINNSTSANAITATTNIFWADGAGGQTGSRTLADGGWLTWWKQADAQFYITGVGIS